MDQREWFAMEDARTTENLNLLGTFQFVLGCITAVVSCIPILHVIVGFLLVFEGGGPGGPPPMFGMIFVVVGLSLIFAGWALAFCMFLLGHKLRTRRSWLFCMIVAGIECLFMPLGTVLGVFTIITLNSTSGRRVFGVLPPSASMRASGGGCNPDAPGNAAYAPDPSGDAAYAHETNAGD